MEPATNQVSVGVPHQALVNHKQVCGLGVTQAHSNTSVPACRLPAEILSKIFATVAASPQPEICIGRRRDLDLSRHWFKLTHVCRYWREIANDCTALWTKLPILSPAFSLGILCRTKNAPLSINFQPGVGDSQGRTMEMLKQVFSQFHRLREVNLEYHPWKGPRTGIFLSECHGSAPLLEKLVIKYQEFTDDGLPNTFLHGGAPSLRHLELHWCGALWSAIPFSASLRRLRLDEECYNSPSAKTRPSIPDFLAVLEEMPVLEDLSLVGVLPSAGMSQFVVSKTTARHITLPTLTSLKLHDYPSPILRFIELVSFPQLQSMEIELSDPEVSPAVVGGIIQAIRATASEHSEIPSFIEGDPLTLTIYGDDDCWDNGKSIEVEFEVQQPQLNSRITFLNLSFKPSDAQITDYLLELSHQIDLSSLHMLEIRDDSNLQEHIWTSAFSCCTNLLNVSIYNSPCLKHFLRALRGSHTYPSTAAGDGHISQNSPSPFLPALKMIELECARPYTSPQRWRTKWFHSAKLAHTLKMRSKTSSPIAKLVLKLCPPLDPQDEELLQRVDYLKIVRDGEYEGVEESYSTDEDST